jgi:thiol:disulfide interchange protein DsbD
LAHALENEPLPPEQVFPLSARALSADRVLLTWDIAPGHYLYRNRFKFASRTAGVTPGEARFSSGERKHDDHFGEMEIFRGHMEVELPLMRATPAPAVVALEVTVQGCADAGLCYPPYKRLLNVSLPAVEATATPPTAPGDPLAKLGQAVKGMGIIARRDDLLPPDQAFHFIAEVKDAHTLHVSWQIAEGYYLYRERFQFALLDSAGVELGEPLIPRGTVKQEEEGPVEVFHHEVGFDVPVRRASNTLLSLNIKAKYQGCAEKGVCYPPMEKIIRLDLPTTEAMSAATPAEPTPIVEPDRSAAASDADSILLSCVTYLASCTDRIADALKTGSTWLLVASFFGFGLLMTFSPCIFPMIPILSGIIVGQGHEITTARALLLSTAYVLAAALAYTAFGVLAGLFGGNLQAAMETPWVVVSFSLVFVLLALSMFGFYELQIPAFIQERIAVLSQKQKGGTLLGAAIMGALSALIVGPCMAAPLAGALIYIGQTGDALLGGMALFALGLGMGVPLLVVGASAGKLLPKVGVWMNTVKSVFGVIMLAMAAWLLQRVVPDAVAMVLWASLLIVPAIYMNALDALPQPTSGWRKLWKGVGIVMLAWGVLLLIGAAADSRDPLQPLRGLTMAAKEDHAPGRSEFYTVRTVAELQSQLDGAMADGRWLILDYYADWCVSCQEMDRYTYNHPQVRAALANAALVKADVTANDAEGQALLQRYGLIGPPATLFFGPDGRERREHRLIGFMAAAPFLEHMGKVMN